MTKIDYYGFSYKPDYDFKLFNSENRLVDAEDEVKYAACFSRVFKGLRGVNSIYKAVYTLRCRKKFKYQSGNYCCLNKNQIHKILRYMRDKLEIKVSFQDTENNYIFVFEVEGKPVKHKFVLTFSRVFFEFPYNEIAKETLKMRDMGVINGINFTHKNFLALFHTICVTYRDYWGWGHSLFLYPCKNITTKVMKQAFKEGKDRVQDVYAGDEQLYKKFKRISLMYKGNQWETDFENRVIKYADNFKVIKNVKGIRRRARKVVQ